MDLDAIFKAYDIRGVYPEQIDAEAAYRIGRAFATFVAEDGREPASGICVGRDMRISSPELAEAFIRSVTDAGLDAIDLGLVSTDMLYFVSGDTGLPGAMFTASHNPGRYNGIKLCLAGAAPVGEGTGLRRVKELAARDLEPVPSRGSVRSEDALTAFVDHLLGLIDTSRMKPFVVAVDAANGMGGKVVPALFERLPVKLLPLYFELDGTFPNHAADPIQAENLADLRALVVSEGADLGLAFDGDADRVFLVDERAEPVSGSLTTALVAKRILSKEPGATVIHNAICSRTVPEVVRESGGRPIRSRVGHSYIKELMAQTGAVFGGEHSGHYYFRANYRADSGLLAALYVLELMSVADATLSELLEPLQRYAASGEINTEVDDQAATIERVAEAFADGDQDRLDGLTVDYEDWWFNVRPSNTEPLLRLNVEATTKELMESKRDAVLAIIREA